MTDGNEQSTVDEVDDDPDFNDSDHDLYDDDDMLFERNVTEGIEIGMRIALHDEVAPEYDSLSNASSEELKIGSSSDGEENIGKLSFPEFSSATGKENPELEIGLLFSQFWDSMGLQCSSFVLLFSAGSLVMLDDLNFFVNVASADQFL
ncbi:Hypothetical predicted protein [Olea europaea subsp. europaea]|uniref:Uncharacterized protein n=1 Tax=Olea europaea subsp. europaea TaxID=158383 RepID=A0A8S0QUY8_OLEEU|nr:Hypothetical predicted protein [Olea europaea subsp. europaea]